jgi:hypothetical protein
MIPLGTGLFRAMYDPKKHNMNRVKEAGYKENVNIIEEKLMATNRFKTRNELANYINFNLVDMIK